jgi:hypothetical protein
MDLIKIDEMLINTDFLCNLPQANLNYTHQFFGGMYLRKLCLEKYTFIVGLTLKTDTILILLKGKIKIATNNRKSQMFEAPYVIKAPPNTQRVGFAYEYSELLMVIPTDKININEIIDDITIEGHEMVVGNSENIQLKRNKELIHEEFKPGCKIIS